MGDFCKLLLVEDSDDDTLFFERALRRLPAIQLIGRAPDGDAAIAYLSGSGKYADRQKYPWPDVMILDLKMPRRNGFEVLAWMKGRTSRPKVAVFTTSDLPEDKQRAEELGADLFQTKTFKAEVFDRFVQWICRVARVASDESREEPKHPTRKTG
jgi:two-component system response regulator